MGDTYKVKIDAFEGPLDLLLHLINRYEIDIYDIPVAKITEQYMSYVHTMQRLELDIASEYLVMAATLLAIKSQMLLPNPELDEDELEYEEDPREELMKRLIEYRKFKEAAQSLKERELDTNQIFTRPPTDFEQFKNSEAPIINNGDVTIFDMIGALQKLFQRKEWQKPLETRVHRQEIPIQERMDQIMSYLANVKGGVLFHELFPSQHRSHIVATFLAILELMKKREITCIQEENFTNILIYQMGDLDGVEKV
jgi:segregation and condensation protein A